MFRRCLLLTLHFLCQGLFIEASVRYVTYNDKSGDKSKSYRNIAIALIPMALLFIFFEIKQFRAFQRTGAVGSYLTDAWNYLDVITICLVMASACLMIVKEPSASNETNQTEQRLLISTGFFIFLKLISFLKKLFLPFAIFVSGVLKVWCLTSKTTNASRSWHSHTVSYRYL